jgi:hypothetical protein
MLRPDLQTYRQVEARDRVSRCAVAHTAPFPAGQTGCVIASSIDLADFAA